MSLVDCVCVYVCVRAAPVLLPLEVAEHVELVFLHESEGCADVVVLQHSPVVVQHRYVRSAAKMNNANVPVQH